MLKLDSQFNFKNTDIDLVSFGELLVDLITEQSEISLFEADKFTKYFGGSAANVAINLKRLGAEVRILTKIGNDPFGKFLLKVIKEEGIPKEGIQIDNFKRTPLVFVNKTSETPDWLAYRDADKYIEFNNTVNNLIKKTKIIYLTTFILSQKPSRTTALKIVEDIKKTIFS